MLLVALMLALQSPVNSPQQKGGSGETSLSLMTSDVLRSMIERDMELLKATPDDALAKEELHRIYKVIWDRADKGEPAAAEIRAMQTLSAAITIKERGMSTSDTPLCQSVRADLEVATKAKRSFAMILTGMSVRDGVCHSTSKMVAADWFTRAARISFDAGARESALRDVEMALEVVPHYKPAIQLLDLIQSVP